MWPFPPIRPDVAATLRAPANLIMKVLYLAFFQVIISFISFFVISKKYAEFLYPKIEDFVWLVPIIRRLFPIFSNAGRMGDFQRIACLYAVIALIDVCFFALVFFLIIREGEIRFEHAPRK